MNATARELRHTLRRLLRSPLFSFVTILTLALAIGANTAVFSVIRGVLLKPLPFEDPERLVGVWHTAPGLGWDTANQSPSLYLTYREEGRVFTDSGMWNSTQVAVTGLDQPEQVQALQVTDGILPVLGAQPQLGRVFSREDDSPAGAETVILSHGYWHNRMGGDPKVIGRSLTVNGKPREIIGVMRPDLHFLDLSPSLFLPMKVDRAKVFFGNFSYQGIARLRPGVTLTEANADVARLIPIAMDKFPMPEGFTKAMIEDARLGPKVRPLKEDVVGDIGHVLWLIFGTVALVLLVACANVANLFLVRADSRHHELAVRSALGASRRQVAAELLNESLVLGLVGGALGLGLAAIGLGVLVASAPQGLPRLDEIGIDPVVLLFTFGISLFTALVAGGVAVTRLSGAQLVGSLKEEGRGASASRGRRRARNLLVISQITVALVLLIGSGLLFRSFRALSRVNPGFEQPKQILTFRLSVPSAEVPDPIPVGQLYENLFQRIAAVPGVESVGLTSSVTLDNWNSNDPVFVEDKPVLGDKLPPLRRMKWIAPGYFETMRNPILVGRAITWADLHDRAPVAVVTESLARAYWERPADAVGKRIRASPQGLWREIVGVVADVRDDGVEHGATPLVYWPMVMEKWWDADLFVERSMNVVIRSPRVGSADFLDDVRKAIWSVNSNLPLANVRTMQEMLDRSMARTSFTVVLLGIAALTALLLGAVGIYGVTSYAAAQRTREIGVRMALGARREDVSRLVLRHGLSLAAIGVAAGLAAAVGVSRLLTTLLYEISPFDPLTYGGVGLAVALIAILASYGPARRAASVDPIETLRP